MTRTFAVPDTNYEAPPRDWPWKSAMWLLGRHPRLVQLARRIRGVMDEEGIHPYHLADVFAARPRYEAAWEEYEATRRPPEDEAAWERWRAAGPRADDFAEGLSDLLVMSSGEVASLRLLACFGSTRVPFTVGDLRPLDAEGQRLLSDWCEAMKAA